MKLLIVDNYDSFTFNLYQLAAEVFGSKPVVVKNDDPWEMIAGERFDAAIISPGPGTPEREADFGNSRRVIEELNIPIFGVCLGHQGICHLAGGAVVHAPAPMHGRESDVYHDGTGIFRDIPSLFSVVRYHSLMAKEPLPAVLRKNAWARDGIVMGIAHISRPIWGVQFHPESICTTFGRQLMENFRDMAASYLASNSVVAEEPAAQPESEEPRREAAAIHRQLYVRRVHLSAEPVNLFEQLFSHAPYAFWLDSSFERDPDGRFSFMGAYSDTEIDCVRFNAHTGILHAQRGSLQEFSSEDVLSYLKNRLGSIHVEAPELPFDFNGGFVGYFGYELKAICGARAAHRSPHPDCYLMLGDRFLAIDHAAAEIYLMYVAGQSEEGAADAWFNDMETAIRAVRVRRGTSYRSDEAVRFTPARGQYEYLENIDSCLAAIKDGESYEVCLTNQLAATTNVKPFEYYKRLRVHNPAPYSSYFQFPELSIASSSPERFLKVARNREVDTKPIKGTVKRGATAAEDFKLKRALEEDEKSRSENLMIVDLLRNDLGRVCRVGSVHVPKLMHVESYATVHQLVSTIRGTLAADQTVVDCLRAAFPGGSMTGAPKISTMEIIDELEGQARGVYSGSIGFLAFNGAADLNIVIRTAVFSRNKVTIGVGGAIIALSDPQEEWNEILLKANALLTTFEQVTRSTVLSLNQGNYGRTLEVSKRVG